MSFDLEKKNFENLVHYYGAKLRQIQKGGDPYKIFTGGEIKKLTSNGILVAVYRGTYRKGLSREAIKIVNEFS